VPSTELTPSLAEEAAEEIADAMQFIESSTRADQKLLNTECLRRDGFRCVFSGAYDRASHKASLVQVPAGQTACHTECAHIIPFALGKFDESKGIQCQNKATIWFAIHRYFPSLKGKIHAGNINQPANAITLDPSIHKEFGAYDLSFWPQSQVSLLLSNPYFSRRARFPNLSPITGPVVRNALHYPSVRPTQVWLRINAPCEPSA
jgi:hypothetical protein